MFGFIQVLLVPLFLLIVIPLAIALFAFWIWMLVHAIQNKGLTDGEKTGWVLAIALVHFIGAVIYFFAGRPKAKTPLPQVAAAAA
jgi:hypothetical protein